MNARKLSFQEAWDTMVVFFVDPSLEEEIDREVEKMLHIAQRYGFDQSAVPSLNVAEFIVAEENGLEFLLQEIGLSEEKFLRIISLLRRIGRIPVPFDAEWSMAKVKHKIKGDEEFARQIADLLLDGKKDEQLAQHVPRYYLETLSLKEMLFEPMAARRLRYKRSLIGTYSGRKGYRVESLIAERLRVFQCTYGVGFEKGRSRFLETDIDFAVPSLDDPWVIIMSSFQETTSSGQSTKARDMLSAFERVNRQNIRYGENRAFVNFVDGGGWLARKRDLERLVTSCHYFINLHFLPMLDDILLNHVPKKFLKT